jgi:hypothetical protein
MMTTVKSIWKVLLRNNDGETATIEVENATDQFKAKIMGVSQYDRAGWYAVDAVLIRTTNHE